MIRTPWLSRSPVRVAALQEDPSCHVTFEQRRISEDFGLVDFGTKCHQYLGFVGDFPTISRIFQDTMDTVPEGNDGPWCIQTL